MNIKELVSDNKKAHFLYFNGRTQEFWYRTESPQFSFPVPLSDLGEAILNTEEKALLLMRYIRKHIALLKEAQEEVQPVAEPVVTVKQCDQEVCNCGGLACAPDDEVP